MSVQQRLEWNTARSIAATLVRFYENTEERYDTVRETTPVRIRLPKRHVVERRIRHALSVSDNQQEAVDEIARWLMNRYGVTTDDA